MCLNVLVSNLTKSYRKSFPEKMGIFLVENIAGIKESSTSSSIEYFIPEPYLMDTIWCGFFSEVYFRYLEAKYGTY